MITNVEVPLGKVLAAAAIEEAGFEPTDDLIEQVEALAEQKLWEARVIIAASIAQSVAPSRKRPGRPRKAKTNGAATTAAADGTAPRKRGRPRKNPLPVAPAEQTESAPATAENVEVVG